MKITKARLKEIIKEELARMVEAEDKKVSPAQFLKDKGFMNPEPKGDLLMPGKTTSGARKALEDAGYERKEYAAVMDRLEKSISE